LFIYHRKIIRDPRRKIYKRRYVIQDFKQCFPFLELLFFLIYPSFVSRDRFLTLPFKSYPSWLLEVTVITFIANSRICFSWAAHLD
jgi:hypothetical protein